MRIDTVSGLHGTLIDLVSLDSDGRESIAIVKRDAPVFIGAAYSTHRVGTLPSGFIVAESGNYDMTLDQAREDLARRTGRV